jgi:predicted nucleic acid-binding protein
MAARSRDPRRAAGRRATARASASSPAFLDTGIFIAFLDRSDRLHSEARALFATPPRAWMTSLAVYAETWSWVLHRLGEEPARALAELVEALPSLQLLEITRVHHAATLAMLDRLRGTKLTYVDASSLAFIEARHVPLVWSTDRHLGLTGARVVP